MREVEDGRRERREVRLDGSLVLAGRRDDLGVGVRIEITLPSFVLSNHSFQFQIAGSVPENHKSLIFAEF
jgi:hypothetical protein